MRRRALVVHELSALSVNFSRALDREEMVGYRDRISALISDAAGILATDDFNSTSAALAAADVRLDEFGEKVAALLRSDRRGEQQFPAPSR